MHTNGDRRRRVLSLAKCLEELEATRRELLIKLEDLDARKRAIQLEHNALCNMDATTSNIPDEVLAMVFEAGVEIEPDPLLLKTKSFKFHISEPYPTPIHFGDLVSHVSHRWRSIALAAPRLWTHIRCTRSGPISMHGKDIWGERKWWRERATDYLCRSRSSPVDIHIKGLRVEDYTPPFLQLIAGHLGHCRQLFIQDVPKAVVTLLLRSLSAPAPLLSSFSVGFEEVTVVMAFEDPGFLQFGAPCLITADLHAIYLPRLHPVFASVTSLRMTAILINSRESYALLRDGLMGLKSLNHLEIQFSTYYRPATTDVILVPTVEFLHVDVTDHRPPSFIDIFLGDIQAPSLISLSLNQWDHDYPHPLEPNKFPSLQHLIVYNCITGRDEVDLDNLANVARQFPDITRFTSQINIHNPASLEIILRTMLGESTNDYDEYIESDETRWPNLQTVAVADPPMDVVDVTTIVIDLLSKLQGAGHPLCKLLISYNTVSHADEFIMEALEELIEIEDFTEDWPTPFERGR
ncbi:hypothetical protein FIBSPDRAFT_1038080 [Athelia psychrophila]|uniref:Uncharacterized protein n=1 Tax=Athelia psychrophila TaxID=1759441 RepID=A0A166TPL0_9AGAM|nr:hypothetical protein FIBSPDRAFT_1038080 [Fibularhizoctonia sp. CBS 109695]